MYDENEPLNKLDKFTENQLYIKVRLVTDYCKKRRISPLDFVKLDTKYDIFDFIDKNIEDFNYLDASEVVKEVENYIRSKEDEVSK